MPLLCNFIDTPYNALLFQCLTDFVITASMLNKKTQASCETCTVNVGHWFILLKYILSVTGSAETELKVLSELKIVHSFIYPWLRECTSGKFPEIKRPS